MSSIHKYSIKNLSILFLIIASIIAFLIKVWSYTILCLEDGMGIREMAEVTAILNIQAGRFQSAAYFPDNIYLYGILKPAILSILPFGSHIILANRIFSVLSLLLACGIMWGSINALLQMNGRKLHAAVTFFLTVIYFFSFYSFIDRPDALGFLLSNIIIYLSIKNFKINVILYPILLVCCYMTKQYYLHALLYILFGYIFLHPKKSGYITSFVVCLLSVIGIGLLFLLPQTRYALQHHLNMRVCCSSTYMLRGWIAYAWSISPVFILFIPAAMAQITKLWNGWQPREVYLRLSKNRVLCYLLINLFLISLIMLRMGQHLGAPQPQYFTQIYSPILFLFIAYILSRHATREYDIVTASFFLIIFALNSSIRFSLPKKIDTPEYHALVKDFSQEENKTLGCASTAWIEFQCKGHVDDNGQLYFLPTIYPQKGNFGLQDFKQKAQEHQANLIQKIQNKEFNVVYVDDKEHCFSLISNENILPVLETYYKKEKEIRITPSKEPISRYIPK